MATTVLQSIELTRGFHHSLKEGACVMELVSYIAGEKWSDHPVCTSPCIATFLRTWNDDMNDNDRQMLKPLVPLVIGTNIPILEEHRTYLVIDWYIRVYVSQWLLAANLETHASAILACREIGSSTDLYDILSVLSMARDAAENAALSTVPRAAWSTVLHEARNAAKSAAQNAAQNVAQNVAWNVAQNVAWNVARNAALHEAENTAWNALWSTAWSTALDTAENARQSTAWRCLCPTVHKLQGSALDLVHRMIALQA